MIQVDGANIYEINLISIYVDDRRYNLEAAQALGIDTILFNSRKVLYEGNSVNNFQELANLLLM